MLRHLGSKYENDYDLSILSSFDSKETILSDIVPYPTTYYTSLIGSVNGLVCLGLLDLPEFVIWNPAIRQAKIFKMPSKVSMRFQCLGFGWDAVDNDYKVVMSFSDRNYVYSCKSDCWTLHTSSTLNPPGDRCVPSVNVKGEPYWTSTYEKARITYVLPFKFDVARNEFTCLPEFEYKSEDNGLLLVDVKECISALIYQIHSYRCSVDAYCLDDSGGAWRKMYNVGTINCYVKELSYCFTYSGQIMILFNRSDEEVRYASNSRTLMLQKVKRVVCYDPELNKVEDFGNKKGALIKCFSYKASLVYVQGMKPCIRR